VEFGHLLRVLGGVLMGFGGVLMCFCRAWWSGMTIESKSGKTDVLSRGHVSPNLGGQGKRLADHF
jgi:hypothetical protein